MRKGMTMKLVISLAVFAALVWVVVTVESKTGLLKVRSNG